MFLRLSYSPKKYGLIFITNELTNAEQIKSGGYILVFVLN